MVLLNLDNQYFIIMYTYCSECIVYTLKCIVYTLKCIVYTLKCIVYTVCYRLLITQYKLCTLHSIHYTLFLYVPKLHKAYEVSISRLKSLRD